MAGERSRPLLHKIHSLLFLKWRRWVVNTVDFFCFQYISHFPGALFSGMFWLYFLFVVIYNQLSSFCFLKFSGWLYFSFLCLWRKMCAIVVRFFISFLVGHCWKLKHLFGLEGVNKIFSWVLLSVNHCFVLFFSLFVLLFIFGRLFWSS